MCIYKDLKSIKTVFITVLFFLSSAINAHTSLDCPNSVPVIEFIQSIEKSHNITFNYSPSIWKDMKICPTENLDSLDKLIEKLVSDLPVEIKQVSDNVYLLIPVRTKVNIKLTDEETKEHIPFAYITANNQDKAIYFASGDYIEIPGLIPSDKIVIESTFYNPREITASEIFNGHTELDLKTRIIHLDQVIVIPDYMTKGIDSKLGDLSLNINVSELNSIAGETDGDVYQVLKAIPGINSPSGKPGTIVMRGNLFDLNLIQFDNIPIYHTGHIFGSFSPFNPVIIQSINVFRNSVPIDYGSKAGGMIDITSRSNIMDSIRGSFLANTVFSGVEVSTPIVRDKIGILISARSSYPFYDSSPKQTELQNLSTQGSIVSPAVVAISDKEVNILQDFLDMNAKIVYLPSVDHKVSISSIFIDNYIEFDLFQDPDMQRYERIDFINKGLTGKWKAKWSKLINTDISLTFSEFFINSKIDQENYHLAHEDPDSYRYSTNSIIDYKFKSTLLLNLDNNNKIKTGVDVVQHKVESTLSTQREDSYKKAIGIVQSAYINYEKMSFGKLISNIGVRGNYYNRSDNVTLDSKVSLTYILNKDLFVKTSVGQMHQFLRQNITEDFDDYKSSNQIWSLAQNKDEIVIGKQAMLGAIYKKGRWLIDMEAYLKRIENVHNLIGDDIMTNPGSGGSGGGGPGDVNPAGGNSLNPPYSLVNIRSKGVDVLIKKKWNQVDTWISYSLSKTELLTDSVSPMYFDQRHVFSITGIIPYKRFTFSLSWNLSSGLPVLPINFTGDPNESSSIDIPYDDRYPAQHQLDLSITSKIFMKNTKIDGVIGFSLLNAYNQENIVNNFYHIEDVEDVYRYGIGITPNLQIEISF